MTLPATAFVFEIPLNPRAQTFIISLAGVEYRLTIVWNAASATWVMDIADAAAKALIQGIPLVTGSNLIEQFDYLKLGGSLQSFTDYAPDSPPTYDNLGTAGHLYYVTV